MEDAVAQRAMQALGGDDVHPPSQQRFCIHLETTQIKQGSVWQQFDEEVHITRLRGLAPAKGAKDAHMGDAMLAGQLTDAGTEGF